MTGGAAECRLGSAIPENIAADRLALLRLIDGYRVTQVLVTSVELGLPDLLAAGPRPCAELAREAGAEADSLYRLLRALVALGVLEEDGDGVFSLTGMGRGLASDAHLSLRDFAGWEGRDEQQATWRKLRVSVRTGRPAFGIVHGADIWTWLSARPDAEAMFGRAMSSFSGVAAEAVVEAFDFSPFERVVDIGGSRGALLAAVLARSLRARGVLFDRPEVVPAAREALAAAGLAERCEVVEGDFFESVPAGGGAYVLKSVLHDWSDEDSLRILRTCVRDMAPGAVLLVVERVLGPPTEGANVELSDLNMLVMTGGGRERTRRDWEQLLGAAGLTVDRVVATRSAYSVIEARVGVGA